MTVADLIEKLQKMPPHAPVWIQSVIEFQDGYGEGTESTVATECAWQGNHAEIK